MILVSKATAWGVVAIRARGMGSRTLRPVLLRKRLLGAGVLVAAGLLVGCAGGVQYTSSYPRPPEHFAEHNLEHPFFDVHWTAEPKDGRVVVEGIVTASRVNGIQNVTVEVVGLDANGQVVSRALGTTYGGRMQQYQSRPFSISLRPTGRETRYAARVWHFRWEFGPNGNGSRAGA